MEGLKVAKLVSNEFIIGRELESGYLVNVFKINIAFDQVTGQPNLNIIPYMFPINANLNYFIGSDKIICMVDADEKMQQLYLQHLTSILQSDPNLPQSDENVESTEPTNNIEDEQKEPEHVEN